MTFSYN